MACDCIDQMNERMKEKNMRLSVTYLILDAHAGEARMAVPTTWIERPKSGAGLTRKEPGSILLEHCPFCFVLYADEERREVAPIRRPAR